MQSFHLFLSQLKYQQLQNREVYLTSSPADENWDVMACELVILHE